MVQDPADQSKSWIFVLSTMRNIGALWTGEYHDLIYIFECRASLHRGRMYRSRGESGKAYYKAIAVIQVRRDGGWLQGSINRGPGLEGMGL